MNRFDLKNLLNAKGGLLTALSFIIFFGGLYFLVSSLKPQLSGGAVQLTVTKRHSSYQAQPGEDVVGKMVRALSSQKEQNEFSREILFKAIKPWRFYVVDIRYLAAKDYNFKMKLCSLLNGIDCENQFCTVSRSLSFEDVEKFLAANEKCEVLYYEKPF